MQLGLKVKKVLLELHNPLIFCSQTNRKQSAAELFVCFVKSHMETKFEIKNNSSHYLEYM